MYTVELEKIEIPLLGVCYAYATAKIYKGIDEHDCGSLYIEDLDFEVHPANSEDGDYDQDKFTEEELTNIEQVLHDALLAQYEAENDSSPVYNYLT